MGFTWRESQMWLAFQMTALIIVKDGDLALPIPETLAVGLWDVRNLKRGVRSHT